MLRRSLTIFLLGTLGFIAAPASGATFPDKIGDFSLSGAIRDLKFADRALAEEYGLLAAEQAAYVPAPPDSTADAGKGAEKGQEKAGKPAAKSTVTPRAKQAKAGQPAFTVSAWRLRDSTDAMAFYQAERPAGWAASNLTEQAVASGSDVYFAKGNYVFKFEGRTPTAEEWDALWAQLPLRENSSLPIFPTFLPAEDRVAGSERYILGPVSLERFQPGIPPSTAAFSMGAEAQVVRYRTGSGAGASELTVGLYNYPTPGIARQRQDEFLKLPGTLAKRTGPLVAVVVQPTDQDAAERVLAKIEYQANITWSEPIEKSAEAQIRGWGDLIVSGFIGAGVIGGAGLLVALGLIGFRQIFRKLGWQSEPDSLTVFRMPEE